MKIQPIGYRIGGFYRVAKLGILWSIMPKDAQQRLHILDFAQRYGKASRHSVTAKAPPAKLVQSAVARPYR